jgi:hypothetical protein
MNSANPGLKVGIDGGARSCRYGARPHGLIGGARNAEPLIEALVIRRAAILTAEMAPRRWHHIGGEGERPLALLLSHAKVASF